MSIKCVTNKILAFSNGERDKRGALIRVKTKMGFCELPEWVAQNSYYKTAVRDGSIKPYGTLAESDKAAEEQSENDKLRIQIEELKAQIKTNQTDGVKVEQNPVEKESKKSGRPPKNKDGE